MKTRGLWALLVGVLVVGLLAAKAHAGNDDWEVVTSPQEPQNEPQAAPQPQGAPQTEAALAPQPSQSAGAVINACGEPALPASPQVRAIVDDVNRVWGSDVRVYQSVEPSFPHARPGGCIFYHPRMMAGLLTGWMNIKEARAIKPMVYAIFAHEVGHEVHDDFSPSRRAVSEPERELEADRFAGYTMSYLRIQPDDIETYYRLTGDDFTGAHNSHGTSDQRAQAFEHGWKLAEAGSSEQSVIPAAGLGNP